MKNNTVKFNTSDKPEFIVELRKRINTYFKENNLNRYGSKEMHVKTVFMILLYVLPWVVLSLGIFTSMFPIIALWVLIGIGMAGIGLSIMHDANHGSYSKNQKVNKRLGYLMNCLGGNHITWKIQHNTLHHSFTNVDGLDEDIDIPVMRFSPDQKRHPLFRFQAIYGIFFYGLLTLFKYLVKDFVQLADYEKRGLLKKHNTSLSKAIFLAILMKIAYAVILVGIPVMLTGMVSEMIIGFLVMHFVCGLILAFIFQCAHVLEETSFYQPDEDQSVEASWAILQMRTTANFAKGNKVLSWFIGGLNYQIEHHLFPTICHIHYKKMSPIVKATAEEFGVPYYEHKTFTGAIGSHLRLLHKLGKA